MTSLVEVGRVKEIWRYPVKSMAGERLEAAHVSWHGIDGDRRAAFVRGDNRTGFPWLTARQVPALLQYRPRYTDPAGVLASPVRVQTPDGRDLPLDAPELQAELAQAYGRDVSLIRIKRGIYDTFNVSIVSAATLAALAASLDLPPDGRRWRQNVIIETAHGRAFAEEAWVGQVLAIGPVRLRLNQRIPRCQMVNLDPDTAVRDPRVLKLVAQKRDECVGVGCTPETTGIIRVGDTIRLLSD